MYTISPVSIRSFPDGRRFLLHAITLFLLTGVLGCSPVQEEATPRPAEETRRPNRAVPTRPFQIIGNVYYVGQTDNSLPGSDDASYLITSPEGHVLLDSGEEHTIPQIQANVREMGFRMEDIKYLVHSHSHADHVAGDALIQEAVPGIELWVMEGDAEVVSSGGEADFDPDRPKFAPAEVDRVLKDGDQVQIGGITLVAHHTAGHTEGCTSWSTEVEDGGENYSVIFVCSARISGGMVLVDNPRYPAIADDFQATFAKLRALQPDVFLASHGFFFGMAEKAKKLEEGVTPNPFIDPEGYTAFLDEAEGAFLAEYKNQGGMP
ncbi:MAG: subclass B3 metallo-beta-lactamase [Acidobacteria bacterium]|nr:subclass B3 metallo-beta-lactamase [Acidobacteriota bacterium]